MKLFFQNMMHSKMVVGILYGIGICVVALLVFQAGVYVGFQRASYGFRMGESYQRVPSALMRQTQDQDVLGPRGPFQFDASHGVVGTVKQIQDMQLFVLDQNNVERSVLLTAQTVVRKFQETITPNQLQVGDFITVVGSPNTNAQLEAGFIRVLPPSYNNTQPQNQ